MGKVGAKLPAIFGVGFAYVPTLTAIGAQYGIKEILGVQVIGGISMLIICIVNSVQTIGDLSATTVGGMNRELKDDELSGGLIGNGICTAIGSIFGALPTASFSQNVGIVAMTKVISRFVLAIAAVFLLIAGFIPKFGAIMTTIPYAVLGGATITVFGMITMTGIKLIIKDELSARNVTIVSLALALSMGIYAVPESIEKFPEILKLVVGGSPIVVAAIISFFLNIILPKKSLEDEENERIAMENEIEER